jgi:hypothetical protein
MNGSGKRFVAWTGEDFKMFRLEDNEHIQTYVGEKPKVFVVRDAAFSEDGLVFVGGTDNGVATVFNVKSGAIVQTLEYPGGGLVQPVAVRSLPRITKHNFSKFPVT